MEDRVREKEPVMSHEIKGIKNTEAAVGTVLTLLPSAVEAVAAPGLLPLLYGINRTSQN
jgi:hypothetical protein